MHAFDPVVVTLAMVTRDAKATGEAVLQGDLDEARFRTRLLAFEAGVLGLVALSSAAELLGVALGPMGGRPTPGYGAGLLHVADELHAVMDRP